MTRTMSTMGNRINGLGLSESSVQERQGVGNEAEVLVSLPGLDDPDRVKSILRRPRCWNFTRSRADRTRASRKRWRGKRRPPAGHQADADHEARRRAGGGLVPGEPRAGDHRARPARRPSAAGPKGKWETHFVIAQDAKNRFGRFTEANIGQRLAIALDGQIKSAPVINARIEDQGVIEGCPGQQEAEDLALVLNAGSLPAGIRQLQETTVGPSLGADSIRSGLMSGLVGLIVVIFLMLLYYARSGINATVALLMNAIILSNTPTKQAT